MHSDTSHPGQFKVVGAPTRASLVSARHAGAGSFGNWEQFPWLRERGFDRGSVLPAQIGPDLEIRHAMDTIFRDNVPGGRATPCVADMRWMPASTGSDRLKAWVRLYGRISMSRRHPLEIPQPVRREDASAGLAERSGF